MASVKAIKRIKTLPHHAKTLMRERKANSIYNMLVKKPHTEAAEEAFRRPVYHLRG